jgi:hypothetical protein
MQKNRIASGMTWKSKKRPLMKKNGISSGVCMSSSRDTEKQKKAFDSFKKGKASGVLMSIF